MSVCLEYQSVFYDRSNFQVSLRVKLFAACIILCALLFRVWIKVNVTDFGYEIARERERAVALDMELRDLKLQESILFQSDNLKKLASQRLGLAPVQPGQVERIYPGGAAE